MKSMSNKHQLIVIAAYDDLPDAHQDFGELEGRLKHGMELRSAALVTKDDKGEARVEEAVNKHGRTGMMIGVGVGALLGLVFEPLLLGALVGGAGGALVTAVAEHELRSGIKQGVGDALDSGTAVVLALTYPGGRAAVENTLIRARSFTALEMDSSTMDSVDAAVAAEIAKLPGHGVSAGSSDTSS